MANATIPADLAARAEKHKLRLRVAPLDEFDFRSSLMVSEFEAILTVHEGLNPADLHSEIARQLAWLDEHYGTPEKAATSRRLLAERTADVLAWADEPAKVPLWVLAGFIKRNPSTCALNAGEGR